MSSTVIDLATERLKRDQSARPAVAIERIVDPDLPDRTFFRFRSASSASIQCEINYLVAQVESFGNGGRGDFIGPYSLGDGTYMAIGKIVVFPNV